MAHKASINGTAYEIGGGKTLIDGTGYSIDKGKTLVGGTAYEIRFGASVAAITIRFGGTVSGKEHFAYISFLDPETDQLLFVTSSGKAFVGNLNSDTHINISGGTIFDIPVGSKIECCVTTNASLSSWPAEIKVNGETKAYTASGELIYDYTIAGRATITLQVKQSLFTYYGTVEITEE